MITQLVLGTITITLTLLTQAGFVSIAINRLAQAANWINRSRKQMRRYLVMVGLTLWVLLGLTGAVWIWAALYFILGVFESFETALYFSVVAFTTLGFGDITLNDEWRIMSGMMAANGLVLFSLNTAFIFEALRGLNQDVETSLHALQRDQQQLS